MFPFSYSCFNAINDFVPNFFTSQREQKGSVLYSSIMYSKTSRAIGLRGFLPSSNLKIPEGFPSWIFPFPFVEKGSIAYNPSLILQFLFFFNDTATTEIYTLSLHDALPIWPSRSFSSPNTPT